MTPFIVAEMSCNHLGSFDRAHALVRATADAGADGFKVQVWQPDTMCIDPGAAIVWQGKSTNMMQLYREAWTPWDWLPELFALARDLGMVPFGAAFDRASVDYLESLNVDRHKVASFELTDLPLIRYMASKGKPMILSTGMATESEVIDALKAAHNGRASGNTTLLRCVSAYPAEPTDANLATLRWVKDFGGMWPVQIPPSVGISDHSLGIGVSVAAAALGATMIEKHLTLSRADGGPDASFSIEPDEFKQMVTECRRATAAIGVPSYGPGPNESTNLRRSLWVSKDIAEGEALRLGDNVVTARPALGIHPDAPIEGCRARFAMKAGTPLTAEGVQP